jgi:hypothetical protein
MTSTAAKAAMVTSTTMIDLIRDTPSAFGVLGGLAVKATPASIRSSALASTADDPFDGIPNKVLVIGMRANNIGAIAANYDFDGSVVAGSTP